MTQDLANKLIAHYEESIREIEKMDDVFLIKEYLRKMEIDYGVCNCSIKVFRKDLRYDSWVRSNCGINDFLINEFWFGPPILLRTKDKILEALQVRVNILKTFKD